MAGAVARPRRIVAGLVAAGALAAALVGSTSAQAAGNDHSSCVFQGLTGTLTPPVPPGNQTGTGTYTFNGGATCVIADKDEGAGTAPQVAVTITSKGSYNSLACGTGFVGGSDTTISGPNPELPVSSPVLGLIDYEINFVGGTGPLLAQQGSSLPGNTFGPMTGALTDGDGETVTAAGTVTIIPVGSDCVTSPVGQFQVAGSLHAST
jgi:hypothetical protein